MIFLLIAALVCRPHDAPCIVYPACATVTTNGVRSASIPGSVTFSNSVKRLDSHAGCAMYGMYDALIQRRVFPELVNYGGARGKGLSDIPVTDLIVRTPQGWRDDALSWLANDGLSDIAPRSARTFTNEIGRLAGVYQLIDERVLGYENGDVLCSILGGYYGLNEYRYQWLVPGINHEELASGEWSLDNEIGSTKWNRYLLSIGELVGTDIPYFANKNPFGLAGFHLTPQYRISPASYLRQGQFQNVFDEKIKTQYLDGKPVGSERGKAYGKTIGNLLSENAAGTDFSTLTNRTSQRVWWNRHALLDSLLSLCTTLKYEFQPNYSIVDKETLPEGTIKSPMVRYVMEQVRGEVIGSIVYTNIPSEPFPIFSDSANECAYVAFDPDKWQTAGSTNENHVSCSTNVQDYCCSAYNDVEGSGYVKVYASRELSIGDFELTLPAGVRPGTYPLTCEMRADTTSYIPTPYLLFYYETPYGDMNLEFGKLSNIRTNWNAAVSGQYAGTVEGCFPNHAASFIGPSEYEWRKVPGEDEYNHSINLIPPHPMLFSSGILTGVSLMASELGSVSTNDGVIAGVSSGGDYAFTQARDIPDGPKKDCWAMFRQKLIAKDLTSEMDIYRASENNFYDLNGTLHELAYKPGNLPGYKVPDRSSALVIGTAELEEIMKEESGAKLTYSRGAGVKGGFDPHVRLVVIETREGFDFYLLDDYGNIIQDSDYPTHKIGRLEIVETVPFSEPKRKSRAVYYDSAIFLITHWNFPMMSKE